MNKRNTNKFGIAKQQGFTLWSFLFVGGVFIFVLYVGAKLVPVLSADNAIKGALNASLETVAVQDVRKKAIIKDIDQRLYIDGIYNGPELEDVLTVEKTREGTTVAIEYREDIPLFFNIGMHLDFLHTVEK